MLPSSWSPTINVTTFGGDAVGEVGAILNIPTLAGANEYVGWFAPRRNITAETVSNILNHYPGCGAHQSAPGGSGTGEGVCRIYLHTLIKGDVYCFFVSAYDGAGGKVDSSVYEFTAPGTAMFPQTLGATEVCNNSVGAVTPPPSSIVPAPVTTVAKVHGKK